MSYQLPFKRSEVKLTFVTIADETGNYEIELPDRPYTYKDQQWVVANSKLLEENNMGAAAEYVLRSHLEGIPEDMPQSELLSYPGGGPFSMYFCTAIAAHLLNKVKDTQERLERLGDDKESEGGTEPKRGNKSTRKGIQKYG